MLKLHLLNALYSLGALGPWVVIPVYVVAMTLFVPNPILGLASGAMFGTWAGFLLCSYSSVISAGCVFLAGRHLTRGWVFKKIIASPKVRAVDDAVTKGGWKMVALIRQTAILPFSVMNYGLGLSKIPFRHYILATWFSMMPGCLLYAYLGSLAGEMVFEGRQPKKTLMEWAFFTAGIAVTVGLGIYATKRIKKILRGPVA